MKTLNLFEYKVDLAWGNNEEHQKYLNRQGKEGWELVFCNPSNDITFITYTFKRLIELEHCQCSACENGIIHSSDCAVHNEPAMLNGKCDCGVNAT